VRSFLKRAQSQAVLYYCWSKRAAAGAVPGLPHVCFELCQSGETFDGDWGWPIKSLLFARNKYFRTSAIELNYEKNAYSSFFILPIKYLSRVNQLSRQLKSIALLKILMQK
jgi:hypothetical protein